MNSSVIIIIGSYYFLTLSFGAFQLIVLSSWFFILNSANIKGIDLHNLIVINTTYYYLFYAVLILLHSQLYNNYNPNK